MSDRELRELERRYLADGDREARELLVRARLRAGEIPEERLWLAQHLRDPLALELLGPPLEPAPKGWLTRTAQGFLDRFDFPGIPSKALELMRWTQDLFEYGTPATAEAARCALGVARHAWVALDEGWHHLRSAEQAENAPNSGLAAGECARIAAQAVGTEPVRAAIVDGLRNWALALPGRPPTPVPPLRGIRDGRAEPIPRLVDQTLGLYWRRGVGEFTIHRSDGLTPHLALHERLREVFLVRILFLADVDPVRPPAAGTLAPLSWTPHDDATAIELTLELHAPEQVLVRFPDRG